MAGNQQAALSPLTTSNKSKTYTEGHPTSSPLFCLNKKKYFNFNSKITNNKVGQAKITVTIFIFTLSFIITKENYNYNYLFLTPLKTPEEYNIA